MSVTFPIAAAQHDFKSWDQVAKDLEAMEQNDAHLREIDALLAEKVMGWNRDTDALLAEKVMGWKRGTSFWRTDDSPTRTMNWVHFDHWRPTESIEQAWEVISVLGGGMSFNADTGVWSMWLQQPNLKVEIGEGWLEAWQTLLNSWLAHTLR
jgi:hypothetical protein